MLVGNSFELLREDFIKNEDSSVEFKEGYVFNGLFQFFAFEGLALSLILGGYGFFDPVELLVICVAPIVLGLFGLALSLRSVTYRFNARLGEIVVKGYKLYPVLSINETYRVEDISFEVRRKFIVSSPPRRWYCVLLVLPSYEIVFNRSETLPEARSSLRKLARLTGVQAEEPDR